MSQTSYKDAGVDLDLYQKAMDRLPAMMQRTRSSRVMELTGGFAGLFRLQDENHQYTDPVLVSGTDGVGTKIKVAIHAGQFNTIGIDLVAMCVNDCLCLGAEPLFFLDYLALGKDNPDLIAQLVEGVTEGCLQSQSSLLGGETAIMPDLYSEGDFDMAGFSVGVVERSRILDGSKIAAGDMVIGLASSGFHSNGYSLLRKVILEQCGFKVTDKIDELDSTVGEVLLKPTQIYTQSVQAVLKSEAGLAVHGMAHITGGGLAENIERILPEKAAINIDRSTWEPGPVYKWLNSLGKIAAAEQERVFNMGVGYCLIVAADQAEKIMQVLAEQSLTAWQIGSVSTGEKQVKLTGEFSNWS
ncbi:Phosphoribosylformylglycinamidine cyclo-ligase [Polystyrenella longa]|uniref:Phosphoribosylformylglycinamidine cyclo-ligase n=1 Tax=Polystyrenella longa TaxID=2528007 RepID=A0A518CQJ0_9PLAN|nr:phosphoribosylformylglycinamidine cyclo-ligase [Polystyrenella longa]QDU81491.1 Phosphoribosylformylglycinamidine cyclo-ligase [Polystyrenella longa]